MSWSGAWEPSIRWGLRLATGFLGKRGIYVDIYIVVHVCRTTFVLQLRA